VAAVVAAREDEQSLLKQLNWPNHDEKEPPKGFLRRL